MARGNGIIVVGSAQRGDVRLAVDTNVTALLARATAGDEQATNELFPLVYEELRRLAASLLASERPGHTLQPTALVHEAYVRLVGPGETTWQNRAHFFGAAARAIRRILTDYARARAREKRGAQPQRVPLSESIAAVEPPESLDFLALDEALTRLAELDAQAARLVELRFYGGLSVEESAEAMEISPRTAARLWEFARLWLFSQIDGRDRA
jgi:RNA polymerase sigma factor (TIGR02999 family)